MSAIYQTTKVLFLLNRTKAGAQLFDKIKFGCRQEKLSCWKVSSLKN